MNKKGFTLLEVLIVVTIVGILASVVIFSTSLSKNKGADSGIQSALRQATGQAEVYYNSNNLSYEGVCIDDPLDKNTIGRFLVAAQQTYGGPINAPYDDAVGGSFSPVREVCHDNNVSYAVWIPLVFQAGYAFCIDGYNRVVITNSVLGPNEFACPL